MIFVDMAVKTLQDELKAMETMPEGAYEMRVGAETVLRWMLAGGDRPSEIIRCLNSLRT